MDRVIQTLAERNPALLHSTHPAISWRWADVVRRPGQLGMRESMRALGTRPARMSRAIQGR